MRSYFTDSMTYAKPEPKHKLCVGFEDNHITLQQAGRNSFLVRYGKQVDAALTYSEACDYLGRAIMHHAACEGQLDNRMPGERS